MRGKNDGNAPLIHPWHGFRDMDPEGGPFIVKGEGAYLWDQNGQRVFDAVGGLWCTNIGLGRTEMAEAIARQVHELAYSSIFVNQNNRPAVELAEKVAAIAPPHLTRVFFTTGGSTAVDSAVRLVHFYQNTRGQPQKKHIIARRDAYHGSTYLGMSLNGKKSDRMPWFHYATDFTHHVSSPNPYHAPDSMSEAEFCDFLIDELERKIQELGPDNVAAFIAEPVLGAGGVIVPPADYNRRCFELTRKYDILYIADEVITGFGRLGHWFASDGLFGIEPDIVTVAKGISSGYLPLGAVLFSEAIYGSVVDHAPEAFFTNGFTYSGHPVCCAAALCNIAIMERENLFENVREIAPYFQSRLKELEELPLVGEARGMGFMAAIECVADKERRTPLAPEFETGKRIQRAARKRRLLVRPIGNVNAMSPPLIMSRADVDFIVETLKEAVREVASDLVRDDVVIE